jgi:sigma-B regulation protein RsbU (phosphoserine phosphatase)
MRVIFPHLMIMNGVITTLRNGATFLGWLPELPFLEIGEVKISDQALIFTFTDGLTEARNSHGDEFGEERLATFLQGT